MRFSLLEDPSDISSIRTEWGALARANCSPFGFPEFFEAWRAAFGTTRRAFVVAGRRGSSLAIALPFYESGKRAWSSLGEMRADYTEAAVDAADVEAGASFWRWVEHEAPCESLKLARFPVDSLLGKTLPAWSRSRNGRAFRALVQFPRHRHVRYLLTTEQREHPFADAARIQELSSRVDAKYMRRNMKMLEKHGPLRYDVLRDADAISPLLERFFEMHVHNFAGTDRVSQFTSPADRLFYEQLVARPTLRGVIRMDVLAAGDQIVAMHLGFDHRGWIYYYKPTFDLTHGKASPGKVMLAHLFAQAARDGTERIDLLKGTEAYKEEWANHSRPTATTNLVERSVKDLLGVARRRFTHA